MAIKILIIREPKREKPLRPLFYEHFMISVLCCVTSAHQTQELISPSLSQRNATLNLANQQFFFCPILGTREMMLFEICVDQKSIIINLPDTRHSTEVVCLPLVPLVPLVRRPSNTLLPFLATFGCLLLLLLFCCFWLPLSAFAYFSLSFDCFAHY